MELTRREIGTVRTVIHNLLGLQPQSVASSDGCTRRGVIVQIVLWHSYQGPLRRTASRILSDLSQ